VADEAFDDFGLGGGLIDRIGRHERDTRERNCKSDAPIFQLCHPLHWHPLYSHRKTIAIVAFGSNVRFRLRSGAIFRCGISLEFTARRFLEFAAMRKKSGVYAYDQSSDRP
jgi:hypothetical protein